MTGLRQAGQFGTSGGVGRVKGRNPVHICLPVVRIVGQPRQALPGFSAGGIGLDGSAQKTTRPGNIALADKDAGSIEVELGLLAGIGALTKALQAGPVVCQSGCETPL